MFRLIQSTPVGGDYTCGYRVIFDRDYTVREFIETVLREKSDEWGCISVYADDFSINKHFCHFSRGIMTSETFPDNILERKVKEANSNGGWSRMDYRIMAI